LMEVEECRSLRHIRLVPLDVSKLKFVEGMRKGAKDSGQAMWEEYVYGILEGTLADEEAEGVLIRIPPEDVAHILSSRSSDRVDTKEGYDRVITTYLSKKGRKGLNRDSLNKFMTLLKILTRGLRSSFSQGRLSISH